MTSGKVAEAVEPTKKSLESIAGSPSCRPTAR